MKKEQGAVFDRRVGAISGVFVTVYNHGTTEKPTIYSDNGVTPQANPFQTDSMGRWAFYVANGRYDIEFSGATISTYLLEDGLIEEAGTGGDAAYIQGHYVNETALGDDKVLVYKVAGDEFVYEPKGTPDVHAASHENGGGDEISVAGLSGLLGDPQTPIAHAVAHENAGSDEISVAGLSGLLGDAQTPLAHKTSHQDGGGDEISVAGLSGVLADKQDASKIQGHSVDEAAIANDKVLVYKVTGDKFVYESKTTPGVHATSHEDGGGDEINVAGLSGVLADKQNADKIQGHTVDEAAIGNDKILVYKVSGDKYIYEAKGTPSAHAASHQDGGGDEISVAGLSGLLADDQHVLDVEVLNVAEDKTKKGAANGYAGLDASTKVIEEPASKGAASGLAPLDAGSKVPTVNLGGNGADNTKFLRGDQSWQVPAGGGGAKRRLTFPAACFETRINADWAAFAQTQGTNLDFGRLDFDKDTDKKAISPPFRFSNWDAGNITVRIGWKANATTGNVMWVVSFLGRDTTTPEAWDAAFTNHALSAETTPGTAEYLKESVWAGAVGELANNDAVLMKITRDADHASDTLAVDAKLLYVEIEYTEA